MGKAGGMTALHHHSRAHVVIVDHMLLPLPVLLAIFGVVAAAAAGLTVSGLVKRRRGRHRGDSPERALAAVAERVATVEQLAADRPLAARLGAVEAAQRETAESLAALADGLARAFGAAGLPCPPGVAAISVRPDLRIVRGGGGA